VNQNKKVLFVSLKNSARSQIAEGLLRKFGAGLFDIESAGFEVEELDELAMKVLTEEYVDISNHEVKSVFELFKEGRQFNYVITICDEVKAKECPVFPSLIHRIHWSFDDPSDFEGEFSAKLAKTRLVKNEIKMEVLNFINMVENDLYTQDNPTIWKIN